MCRVRSIARAVLLSWALMGGCGSLIAAEGFSKGPYIQFPAPGKVSVMWESLSNYIATVEYGAGDTLDRIIPGITPVRMNSSSGSTNQDFYLYKATIGTLLPGQHYSYRVKAEGFQSEQRQFRTLDSSAEETRFIVYGDSRSDPARHRALTRQFLDHRPEFVLHTGDLVARGRDYSLWWREFFGPLAEVIDRVPFFPVIGNHEQDGTNYLAYFDLPGNELWYSFDSGPVHVLALDFRSEKQADEQYRFAAADLKASRAPWKIVLLHVPVYNLGGHASTWGHQDYLPLFLKSKVDLVLAGHSHIYERFKPLAPRARHPSWAITHITTGGGGAGLYAVVHHPALVAAESTNHFMVFEASRDVLRGQAIRLDGAVFDTFELRKQDSRYSRDFLEGYYPQESLDLFYEFSPVLAPRLAGLPGVENPAATLFTIPPRKKGAPQATMELSLSSTSASTYDLVNGPLRIVSPRPGQTNVVWTQVQTRAGQTISTNKNGELTPPLVFEAKVFTREGEALAVGSKGRVSKTAQEAAR